MSASTSGASCIGTASTWGQTGLTPARRPTPSPAAPRSTPASPEVLACPPPAGRYQLEAGLHYNWHRSYDPTIGRYTQPDPLGFVDGPSVYGYASGLPGMLVDPEGRYTIPLPPQILIPVAIGMCVIAAADYIRSEMG